MKKQWKVGDLAKLTGLTVRTLRFYDGIGLLSPSSQTDSGHRLYSEEDVTRLYQIVSLKELGLSLEEVKAAMSGSGMQPLDVVNLQMNRVQEDIRRQEKMLGQLRYVAKLLQGKKQVSADEFTGLLQTMKAEYDKPIMDRQNKWEGQLNLLGALLARRGGMPGSKEES
jgi:DNA-binding transcriptional MerR regulator